MPKKKFFYLFWENLYVLFSFHQQWNHILNMKIGTKNAYIVYVLNSKLAFGSELKKKTPTSFPKIEKYIFGYLFHFLDFFFNFWILNYIIAFFLKYIIVVFCFFKCIYLFRFHFRFVDLLFCLLFNFFSLFIIFWVVVHF